MRQTGALLYCLACQFCIQETRAARIEIVFRRVSPILEERAQQARVKRTARRTSEFLCCMAARGSALCAFRSTNSSNCWMRRERLFVQSDVVHAGGITELRKIANLVGCPSDFEIGRKSVAMSRDTAGTSGRATGGEQSWLRSHWDSSPAEIYGVEVAPHQCSGPIAHMAFEESRHNG